MSKIVLITNIPAPYRVDLFYYMQTHLKKHEIHVIYTNENEDNRSWNIAEDRMINSHILHSKVIKRKGMLDKRYVHIPNNIPLLLAFLIDAIVLSSTTCLLVSNVPSTSHTIARISISIPPSFSYNILSSFQYSLHNVS